MLRRTSVGDVEVPWLELGEPSAPAVVMIPGLTDGLGPITEARTRALFEDVPLPLDRIRGLVLSHRQPVTTGTDTRALAADLGAALSAILDTSAVLVCHSMGGMVAQHLAADHPELVRGLVLSATAAHADERVAAVLRRWQSLVVAHRFDDFVLDAVGSSFTGPERADNLADVAQDPPPHPPTELVPRHVALTDACLTHDARARLASISAPALVLGGTHDRVIPFDLTEALATGLPAAELHALEGLGHGFPDQAPDRYEALVVPFVEELLAAS